jgi:hypothetical protein
MPAHAASARAQLLPEVLQESMGVCLPSLQTPRDKLTQ